MNARLKEYLSSNGVIFKALTHPPTTTSIESANYRGVPVSQGAKALLVNLKSPKQIEDFTFETPQGVNECLVLVVLSAHLQLDSKKLRKISKAKSVSFADAQELEFFCGVPKGAVPPIGDLFISNERILKKDEKSTGSVFCGTLVDKSILENESLWFNAGSMEESVNVELKDYLRVTKKKVIVDVSKEEEDSTPKN